MISCAITDHEVAYGQVDFYKKKGTRRHLFTNYVRFSKFEALELYEITPFSNGITQVATSLCFRTIRNYTILKLEFGTKRQQPRFRTIRNYTILKLIFRETSPKNSFRTIRNYTILKRGGCSCRVGGCFRTIQIYIILKHEDNLRVLL